MIIYCFSTHQLMVSIKSKNCLINIFQKMDRLIKQSDWLPVDGLPEQLTLWLAKSTSSKYSIRNSCKYREFGKKNSYDFWNKSPNDVLSYVWWDWKRLHYFTVIKTICIHVSYHHDFIFHGRITKFSKSLFSFLINKYGSCIVLDKWHKTTC